MLTERQHFSPTKHYCSWLHWLAPSTREEDVITEITCCCVWLKGMKSCLHLGLAGIWQETTGFQAEGALSFPNSTVTSKPPMHMVYRVEGMHCAGTLKSEQLRQSRRSHSRRSHYVLKNLGCSMRRQQHQSLQQVPQDNIYLHSHHSRSLTFTKWVLLSPWWQTHLTLVKYSF